MKILRWELKKIFMDKALWLLLAACVAIQAVCLWSDFDRREELLRWNGLIEQIGTQITPEAVRKLNALTQEAHDALDAGEIPLGAADQYGAYYRLEKLENLAAYAEAALNSELDFSPDRLLPPADGDSRATGLEQYRDGQIRMRAAQAGIRGERRYFSLGSFLPERESLFSGLFLVFYALMILTAGYVAARSASLEFAEGTQQLVYTCRRGRRLQHNKLMACLIAVTAIYLTGALLLASGYLICYPQGMYLSSPFSADPYAPGLSRFPVSYLGYMFLHLGLGYLIVLVLTLLMFSLVLRRRNPAAGIFLFLSAGAAMVVLGVFRIPELAPLAVNPITLLFSFDTQAMQFSLNSGSWFCYNGNPLSLPHIELLGVLLWSILFALVYLVMIKSFQKREVL